MTERARQFKMLISDEEWQKLLAVAEAEDSNASDVLRDFIHQRHAEVFKTKRADLDEIAKELIELARKVRAVKRK